MTPSVSVDLVGERQLNLLFKTLEPAMGSKVLMRASWHATDPVLADAKRRVRFGNWTLRQQAGSARWRGTRSRGGVNRTVHLRDALRIRGTMRKDRPKGSALITYKKQEGAHAVLLEYGVKPHKIVTTWPFGKPHTVQHPGHRAWPFLRPAYLLQRNQAVTTIRTEVRDDLMAHVNEARSKMKRAANEAGKSFPA